MRTFFSRWTWPLVMLSLFVALQSMPVPAYAARDQGEAMDACYAQGRVTTGRYPDAQIRCDDDGSSVTCKMNSAQASGGAWVKCVQPDWFPYGDKCERRNVTFPPGDAAPWYGEPPSCISGCKISGTPFTQENGGVKVYGMKDRFYTGGSCQTSAQSNNISPTPGKEQEAKPKGPECTALGSGQTACVRPNGDHCATSSTGKTFCWQPNETGKQADGPDAQSKSEKGKPVTPPTHTDPTKEYQRTEGHQQTACINNKCVTYNVTNYTQTGKGEAKNSTGDNSADGTGNTSGNGAPGKGSGSGDGKDGEGDSASDSGNCETPPLCTGDTLKCLHLRFTWKIQCNTKGSEISKGDGCADTDVPVCAGSSCKAEAYAQLLQQWRSRCSVERLTKGVEDHAGQGDGDDGNGSILIDDSGNNPSLDEGKVSYAGGQLGYSFEVEGVKFEMPQQLLDFLPILRMLIIALATLAAIGIMRGNG